jgi:hypothetical protein
MTDPPTKLTRMIEIAVLLGSALIAFVAIAEITVRQDLCKLLEENPRYLAKQSTSAESSPRADSKSDDDLRDALRGKLEALMIVGGSGSDTSSAAIASALLVRKASKSESEWSPLSSFLSWFKTDYLLALALIACGLFGAVVSELRANAKIYNSRQALLGLAAGFIALVMIKGGRAIFLIEHRAALSDFNPYSSGLVALLAGLYSEKAYRLLTRLVQLVTAHIVAESKGTRDENPKQPNLVPSVTLEALSFLEPMRRVEK